MTIVSKNGKHYKNAASKKKAGPRKKRRLLLKSAVALTLAAALYATAVFSNIPFIKKWRTLYIETAMSTMDHQWLATAFIPKSVIDKVLAARYEMSENQADLESSWSDVGPNGPLVIGGGSESDAHTDTGDSDPEDGRVETADEAAFFQLFSELDKQSVYDYVEENPGVVSGGWLNFKLNDASIDSDGTDMVTTQGERVMAIDAKNGILIVREKSSTYRGVLAIIKDPSQVSVVNASTLGTIGQFAANIAADNDALVVIGANGFEDNGGVGNGGTIYGLSIASGVSAGSPGLGNYKRVELRDDDRMYIVNSTSEVASDTRDAAEFKPALIVDGECLVTDSAGWGIQPRTVIGQAADLSILMLVVEGRQGVSNIGITLGDCASILMEHDAVQAVNLDGGSTSIMVYEGEPITMCSNGYIDGRTLPNAFIVKAAEN